LFEEKLRCFKHFKSSDGSILKKKQWIFSAIYDAGYRNVRMSKNKSNVRSTRAQIFFKTEKLPPQIFDSLSFVLFAVQWNGIQAGHEENKGGYTSLSAIIIHQAITSRTLI